MIIGLIVTVFILPLLGADEKKQELSEEDKKALEMVEKYATPGEKHKFLDYFVGEWGSTVKMAGEPGGEPVTYNEEISVKWLLGGRYLHAHLKGTFMGKPYDIYVYNGYDNYKKEFFSIQLSTLWTGYYLSTGNLDESGKIRTDRAVVYDPETGKINVKAVTTIMDKDNYKYEFYIIDDKGKETRTMEVFYKRRHT